MVDKEGREGLAGSVDDKITFKGVHPLVSMPCNNKTASRTKTRQVCMISINGIQ